MRAVAVLVAPSTSVAPGCSAVSFVSGNAAAAPARTWRKSETTQRWPQARIAQDLHGCLFLLLCSVLFMVRPLAHCNRLNWRLLRNFEILCGLND